MPVRKYVPLMDALSLSLLFFLGFYYNLLGSAGWFLFFVSGIVVVAIGGIITAIIGSKNKISKQYFLNTFLFSIYVLAIIVLTRYLFIYVGIQNLNYIIDHYLLIVFFFILFIISLREIFVDLYSG